MLCKLLKVLGIGRQRTLVAGPSQIAGDPLWQYHDGMNLGFPEMIFIFLLALIIFGPKKLPEIGRQIGKAMNEFKRASNEFKAQIESEINNLDLPNERQIMAPLQPPPGSIASKPLSPESPSAEPTSDTNAIAKAPDA
jgi:TatA/E family protein of Tat protein translocase